MAVALLSPLSVLGKENDSGAESPYPASMTRCQVGTVEGVCGSLSVAENREIADGRRLDLFVAIAPAQSGERQADPVVVLEGGPGASVVHFAGLHVQTFTAAAANRDLVLIDQRGTGRSAPLDCDLTDGFTALASPERAATCREALEGQADLTRYTTNDAVLDLADLFDWLGYERVNLFAVSNGTRTALHFARRYPQRVRSMTLIGAYPFARNVLVEAGPTLDRALSLLAGDCAADARCGAAFPDLAAEIEALRSPDPPSDVDWPLFTAMMRMILFFPLPTSQAPSILHSVATGCRPPQPGATGNELAGWISEGAFLSIFCPEDAARTSSEEVRDAALGSFLGAGWAESLVASCEEWPRRPLPDDFEAPLAVNVPTLMLVGRLDPAMPPDWSHQLATTMPNALVVEIPQGQHSFVGMGGVGCILRLMRRFLDEGTSDALDPSCVDTMSRPPFIVPGT